MFNPCEPSGIALPTITSSILLGSKFGNSFIMYLMVSAANSSVLLKRNTPFGALPTAVLYAFTIYAVFILIRFLDYSIFRQFRFLSIEKSGALII